MATSTSSIFSGNSRYSSDFQAVVDRTTAIASLPITAMTTQKTALGDQTKALTDLGTTFKALGSSVDSIASALGGSSFTADVSAPTKLSVTLGDGALEGSYSVEVLDAGAYATSMSTSSWATDSSTSHHYSLSLGGQTYGIAAADNKPATVAAAINSQYGDKVRATVVNVGSAATPDYRISLQSTALGDLRPDLLDGTTSMQRQQTTGVQAHYVVNGSGQDVYSTSRSVTIATGVNVNLLASAAGTPTNITVTRSTSALSTALSSFADAYNASVDALDAQRGQSTGALTGQAVIGDLQDVLRSVSGYSDSGGVGNLTALGLELDVNGHLNYNQFSLIGQDLSDSSGVTSFLGSTKSGFLKLATDALASVNNTTNGLLHTAETAVSDESTSLDASIADTQSRVDEMKVRLESQIAASDALIAGMEQQYSYLSGLFTAMQTADQMYR